MKIKTVCIIDDDPICVYGTKILLNHNNYFGSNILVYEDGYEALVNLTALAAAEENFPDVILLDLNMPIMNGWEFLDEFVKLSLKTKPHIFVVSSNFEPNEIIKGKSYDMVQEFISKPLLEANLTNLLDRAMNTVAN